MKFKNKIFLHAIFFSMLLSVYPAYAEVGDYSTRTTAKYLLGWKKPTANRPLTHADQQRFAIDGEPVIKDVDEGGGFKSGKYYQWQKVNLPLESGAMCFDGSPYHFYVKQVPQTSNLNVMFEGGGACWSEETCFPDESSVLNATNLDGLPDSNSGMQIISGAWLNKISPNTVFDARSLKTQSWNGVFLPYCTGDLHAGNFVTQMENQEGEVVTTRQVGMQNVGAAIGWIRNHLPRPGQTFVSGYSAGGYASMLTYPLIRETLAPFGNKSYLINDSGPVFEGDVFSEAGDITFEDFPSRYLYQTVMPIWGADKAIGMYETAFQNLGLKYEGNFGFLYDVLGSIYPNDRMGVASFQHDLIISSFSYSETEEIKTVDDGLDRRLFLVENYSNELENLRSVINPVTNLGYYMPTWRPLVSGHVTSAAIWMGSEIEEQDLELYDFAHNILHQNGSVMKEWEKDKYSDYIFVPSYDSWEEIVHYALGWGGNALTLPGLNLI